MGGTLSNVEANSLGKLLLDKDSVGKWWSGTGLEKCKLRRMIGITSILIFFDFSDFEWYIHNWLSCI